MEHTGHCSLWALAQEEIEGGLTTLFEKESDSLPVGGAFPVYVDDQMTALIMTSGLHHGKDHEAVVKALCAVRGIPLPAYSGPMI